MDIKEINWYKMKWQYRPRIEYLESCFSGDEGDRFTISLETENELYYDDIWGRYCYLYKNEEGKSFKYIRRGRWIE
jgi:hypothetical protein